MNSITNARSIAFDPVRQEQISEGSRMAREDGDNTLHRPAARRDISSERRENPTFDRRAAFKKDKEKKTKGHEAFLKQLETSGAEIEIEKKSNGEKIKGIVKHSDAYTVTIKAPCEFVVGDTVNRVIFKHDISEFRAMHGKIETTETTETTEGTVQ
jgi:sRNA-binding regulator protein Hfq